MKPVYKNFCSSILFIAIFAVSSYLSAQEVRKGVDWEDIPYSGGYIVEIQDIKGEIIIKGRVERPPFNFDIEPGLYNLRITTLNRWERIENASDWFPFEVQSEITRVQQEVIEPELFTPRSLKIKIGKFIYTEVYMYDLPSKNLSSVNQPKYWTPIKFRLGYKNFLVKGLNIGLQSEFFAFAYKMDLPYGFTDYNIREGGLHALDIFFHLPVTKDLYFVPHVYPIALLSRTIALVQNENGIEYISPMGYLNDQDYVQFITSRFLIENLSVLYSRVLDLFFGGSIGFQYYSDRSPITGTASFNIWGSYGNLQGNRSFDLIVYYAFEAAIGLRF